MGLTLADPARLQQVRTERDLDAWRPTLDRLRRDVGTAIEAGPWAVTDKERLPPSGDPREYLTISEYFWPDPGSPDGLPWLLHDGHINPDAVSVSRNADQLRFMSNGARTFALAGLVLDDPELTERAVATLHRWFLDHDHGMRPNLRFASLIPGRDDPPGWGLIRAHPFLHALEAHSLCNEAGLGGDLGGLDDWFAEFRSWIVASDMWRSELDRGNNHTTWCLALVLGIAIHLDDAASANELAEMVEGVVMAQIDADGRQPHEAARSRSYFYCCFNLDGLSTLADLAGKVGVDCWSAGTVAGDRLRAAMRWMAPRMEDLDSWPTPFHIEWDRTVGASPLHRIVARCPDADDLADAIDRVPVARRPSAREWLLWDTRLRPAPQPQPQPAP